MIGAIILIVSIFIIFAIADMKDMKTEQKPKQSKNSTNELIIGVILAFVVPILVIAFFPLSIVIIFIAAYIWWRSMS